MERLEKLLEKYGQEHLLEGLEGLSEAEAAGYRQTLESIDYELIGELYRGASGEAAGAPAVSEDRYSQMPVTDSGKLTPEERERYIRLGEKYLREGRFCAVTMAGGQGTRLGHNGPKGTFDIGVKESSLFAIQAGRLSRRAAACGHVIPWYIMTSEENDGATRQFFEEHGYFGLGRNNVRFFTQFMLPMVDFEGKIVRDTPHSVKMGADGHGGIFKAMHRHGIVADMRARGIEYAFIGGIDNVLVKLCDPLFIGFAAANGLSCAGKSLIKRDPYEKAGVFCLKDGRPYVVEYTEISKRMAEAVDGNGEYVYGDAHILCNMFSVDMLEAHGSEGLPYHTAVKKTAFVGPDGEVHTPEKPNAYKFEAFIFDAFSSAGKMGVLRVKREDEFAPVKNREGEDSPETARALYLDAEKRGCLD